MTEERPDGGDEKKMNFHIAKRSIFPSPDIPTARMQGTERKSKNSLAPSTHNNMK